MGFEDDVYPITRKNVLKSLQIYLGAIVSLLPGILFGPYILIPWYAAILYFIYKNNIHALINLFVIWNFLGRGAFHYHLLGTDEAVVLIKSMNIAIITGALALLPFNIKKPNRFASKIILLGIIWSVIAYGSAFVNNVNSLEFIQYYIVYFRWFLFGILMLCVKLDTTRYEFLLAMLFTIIGFNGLIAVMQQFVLPIQTTPTGYVPSYYDLASGFLGVTFSQHLTALTMAFSVYFLIKYFLTGRIGELWMFTLFMVQAFSSSSKAFIIIMAALIIFAVTIILIQRLRTKQIKYVGRKSLAIIGISIVGLQIYGIINESEYGGVIQPFEKYLLEMSTPESIMKVAGYITAYDIIAPSGSLGVWMGVGPTNFLNVIDPTVKTDYSKLILRGNDDEDLSTADKQDTEIVANLGELGVLGVILQICMMGYLVVHYIKIYLIEYREEYKSRIGVLLVLAMSIFIFTFYTQAWTISFYYIPLFIFIGWHNLEINENAKAA